MEKGTVYFFTGLAGAGKTTIGGLFYRRLKAKKLNVFCMDGDAMDGGPGPAPVLASSAKAGRFC